MLAGPQAQLVSLPVGEALAAGPQAQLLSLPVGEALAAGPQAQLVSWPAGSASQLARRLSSCSYYYIYLARSRLI